MPPEWNTTVQYTTPLDWYTSAASTSMQVYPAMVAVPTPEAEPDPEPETPLDWLRGQVSEVCELAFAA